MNILVAVDFSAASTPVLNAAKQFAKLLSANVWLIHVAAPDPDFVGYEAGPQVVRDQVSKHLHQEHQTLQREAQDFKAAGVDVTPLLLQGPTVQTLLAEAERLQADLVILGAHGHGALHQMIVGSVSAGVLRKCKTPVLVVPTHPLP